MYFIDIEPNSEYIEAIYEFDGDEGINQVYGTLKLRNPKVLWVNKKASPNIHIPPYEVYVDAWQILNTKHDVIAELFDPE